MRGRTNVAMQWVGGMPLPTDTQEVTGLIGIRCVWDAWLGIIPTQGGGGGGAQRGGFGGSTERWTKWSGLGWRGERGQNKGHGKHFHSLWDSQETAYVDITIPPRAPLRPGGIGQAGQLPGG